MQLLLRWAARLFGLGVVLLLPTGSSEAQQAESAGGTDYVAVGRSGIVLYSTDDGESWTAVTPISSYINGVVSDNRGRFVAVGSGG